MPGNSAIVETVQPSSQTLRTSTRPIGDRLSIVTTYYLIPSAPRMTVLRNMVAAVRKHLRVEGCRHLLYYHAPGEDSPRARQHLDNLRRLCDQYGLELYVRPDSGIKVNLIEALDTVTTPYMLFLEYDLVFRKKVDIVRLLDVFDKYDFVNYVHFSAAMNDSFYLWGHLVHPEDRIPELPLTRTSCWSNQAHVVRLSKWHEEWLGIIGRDKPPTPIDGVEQTMYWTYNREIFNRGFFEAQQRWGVYFYGAMDDGRMIRHIDGAAHPGTILEYVNKARRFAARTLRQIRMGI